MTVLSKFCVDAEKESTETHPCFKNENFNGPVGSTFTSKIVKSKEDCYKLCLEESNFYCKYVWKRQFFFI